MVLNGEGRASLELECELLSTTPSCSNGRPVGARRPTTEVGEVGEASFWRLGGRFWDRGTNRAIRSACVATDLGDLR